MRTKSSSRLWSSSRRSLAFRSKSLQLALPSHGCEVPLNTIALWRSAEEFNIPVTKCFHEYLTLRNPTFEPDPTKFPSASK